MKQLDRSKTLQQLDGTDWGEPTFDSHLVQECHRLHRVPLRDFTVEDLRITIGQDIGLEYLVPLALERLHADPFARARIIRVICLSACLALTHDFGRVIQTCASSWL